MRRKEHTEPAAHIDIEAVHERWSRSFVYHAFVQGIMKKSKFLSRNSSLDKNALKVIEPMITISVVPLDS